MSSSGVENLIVKLRGLPWKVTVRDIIDFLNGVGVANGENGVHIITYSKKHKRPNGEAFVECATEDDYKLAFTYDNKNMGNRYIESNSKLNSLCVDYKNELVIFFVLVFSVKQKEFEMAIQQMKGAQFDSIVRLRGLPWGISEKDIEKFFDGMYICFFPQNF